MPQTKRLTASEREAMIRLNIAQDIMCTQPGVLRDRSRMIKYARRDFAMIAKRLDGLMERLADTVPTDQLKTYVNTHRMSSYTIGARRPGGQQRCDSEYGMWVSYEVLNALFEGCHDRCQVCMEDPSRRRKCRLRMALEAIPNDVRQHPNGDCPFYTVI